MGLELLPALLAALSPVVHPYLLVVLGCAGALTLLWKVVRHIGREDAQAFNTRMGLVAGWNADIIKDLRLEVDRVKADCAECDANLNRAHALIQRIYALVNERTDQRNTARLYWAIYADALAKPPPTFAPDPPDPQL